MTKRLLKSLQLLLGTLLLSSPTYSWATSCEELFQRVELSSPQDANSDSFHNKLFEGIDVQKIKGNENRSSWSPKVLKDSGMAIVHSFNAFGIVPSSPNFILNNGIIPENSILSTSLIGVKKIATAGYFGVILTVPEQSVLMTSATDLDLNLDRIRGDDFVIRAFQRKLKYYGISSPKDILSETLSNDYNEVVISTKGVAISGLFLKTDSKGNRLFVEGQKAVSDEDLALLKGLSSKLNIPITEIPENAH